MENLLQLREKIIEIFKRYERVFLFIIKFAVGFLVYSLLVNSDNALDIFKPLNSGVSGILYILALSFSFAVLPKTLTYLIMIFNVFVSLSSYILIAGIVVFILLCVLVFYARLANRESILIIATLLAFHFKMPYLVPIIAGLYFSITAFLPIVLGTFLWALQASVANAIPLVSTVTITKSATSGSGATDIVSQFIFTNTTILNYCFKNTDFLYLSFIFIGAAAFVYFVSRTEMDFNKQIAVVTGGIINLIGVLFIKIIVDSSFNIIVAIFMIVISVAIAFVVLFFDAVLDYNSVEKVFFQDDDNMYYVKIVPKIKID